VTSLHGIAAALNERGIPTATGYGRWHHVQVGKGARAAEGVNGDGGASGSCFLGRFLPGAATVSAGAGVLVDAGPVNALISRCNRSRRARRAPVG
jgi:hypothetical protein